MLIICVTSRESISRFLMPSGVVGWCLFDAKIDRNLSNETTDARVFVRWLELLVPLPVLTSRWHIATEEEH